MGADAPAETPAALRQIAGGGRLDNLRWPDFTDYRQLVQSFYERSGWTPAWIRNSQATPQARIVIGALQKADAKASTPGITTARDGKRASRGSPLHRTPSGRGLMQRSPSAPCGTFPISTSEG